MTKFTVGDRVKIKVGQDKHFYHGFNVGDIVTIEEVRGEGKYWARRERDRLRQGIQDRHIVGVKSRPVKPKVVEFKKGDKVRRESTGQTVTVKGVSGMAEYDRMSFSGAKEGFTMEGGGWDLQKDWTKVGRSAKPLLTQFVAIYEEKGCGDPVKKFTSKKELVKWIRKAQTDEEILFDSIEVYPVGKELKVKTDFRLVQA